MFDVKWNALIAETRFAVDQSVVGLRELACASHPTRQGYLQRGASFEHSIHSGLFSLTTGIERLGKLAMSAYVLRRDGRYPSVRRYSHDVSLLLKDLADLDLAGIAANEYAAQSPDLSVYADHISLMTDYAKGQQRYEFLDSLAADAADAAGEGLYERWSDLVHRVSRSDADLMRVCVVPQLLPEALYSVVQDEQILIEPYLESYFPININIESLTVAMEFFRLVRWVAAILSSISKQIFYHDPRTSGVPTFPYLSEIIDHHLLHPPADFAAWEILRLGDLDITLETIQEVLCGEVDCDSEDE